jgi:hypothetical protein
MIIVKLDRHVADRTDAFTKWKIKIGDELLNFIDAREKGIVKLIHTTATLNKTHWYEYWEVPLNCKLIRVRRSNRGNINVSEFTPEQLRISREEIIRVVRGDC